MRQWDAIVIGSGIGGMVCAGILSRMQNKRVLVLERHSKGGGYCHAFRRGEAKFDTGVHYVGGLTPGDPVFNALDYLTYGNLTWKKISDPLEICVLPGRRFEIPSDPSLHRQLLVKYFPDERKGIDTYFKIRRRHSLFYSMYYARDLFPDPFRSLLSLLKYTDALRKTSNDILNRIIKSDELKAILAFRYGDYGLPPSLSPIGLQSVIDAHYEHGAYYPSGGSSAIFPALLPSIERNGGEVRTLHEVTEIIIENEIAVGVKAINPRENVSEPREFRAPMIISSAGILNTFGKLLPKELIEKKGVDLTQVRGANSVFSIFITLKRPPLQAGINAANYWIHGNINLDEEYRLTWKNPESPGSCYVTFPSNKGNDELPATCEIIMPVSWEIFSKWKNQPAKKRDPDYYEFKERIVRSVISFVDNSIPGFSDLVESAEGATPLTYEYYGGFEGGAIYGIPPFKSRADVSLIRSQTPVKNLYLTGADSMMAGFYAATMSGIKTAAVINGKASFFRIMSILQKEQSMKSKAI